MSSYTSRNSIILATFEQGDNLRMILLHTCDSGRLQYVIGSYFTESIEYIEPGGPFPEGVIVNRSGECFDVKTGHSIGMANNALSYQDSDYYEAVLQNAKQNGKTAVHYTWDWGHYFDDIVSACDYWKREVMVPEPAVSPYAPVPARVSFQVWQHDYAVEIGEAQFDCAAALDTFPVEFVAGLEDGQASDMTDDVYHAAVEAGLVKDHDGPFSCYIDEGGALATYLSDRMRAEREARA